MNIQRRFPGVHWIWKGGISYVYEVHPLIVVKVPKSAEEEREKLAKELNTYEILSRNQPRASIVQCFHDTADRIFLEYMRDISLAYRRQFNPTRDTNIRVVTKVGTLEPLGLRKLWMNVVAQGVAFLASLGLAHGDLRPENILLDRNRLKLSDFDCTAKFGTAFETCPSPYGRLLNRTEMGHGIPGTAGFLGSRTEQFALGSLYYLIYYGFENMEFATLNGDPLVDEIIDKGWHNRYGTLGDLAIHTGTLVQEPRCEELNSEETSTPAYAVHQNIPNENLSSKQKYCQDLESRGLLRLFTARNPLELGFSMEHRHVSNAADC